MTRRNESGVLFACAAALAGALWAGSDFGRLAIVYFGGALLTLALSIAIDRRPLYVPEAAFWPATLTLLGVLVCVMVLRGDRWEDHRAGCSDPGCRECSEKTPDVETEAVVALIFGTGLAVAVIVALVRWVT